ncbi:MAG: hypothetical protein Q8L23_08960 [Caulobacter sp.]|nr:hypothetical protein [Caulobacter sp.]
MNGIRISVLGMLALGLVGCASTGDAASGRRSDAMSGAVSQPFRDLGMIRKPIPDALAKATASPYATEVPPDCAAITGEIATLDAVLGPDLDGVKGDQASDAEEIIIGALRGALDLPFRGIVRRISGAEKRDRARVAAVLAGMVRRGYLKGIGLGARCPGTAPAG